MLPVSGSCSSGLTQGGKAAAETVLDMRATGDYSKHSTKEYERRWIQAFGHDFHMACDPASSNPTTSLYACLLSLSLFWSAHTLCYWVAGPFKKTL